MRSRTPVQAGLVLALAVTGACKKRPAPAKAAPPTAEAPAPTPAPVVRAPLRLTYLGVAGWQIEGAGKTILVDPYFSRPKLDGPIQPDLGAIDARAPKQADLIVIGHAHIDHVLDAPEVARRTGAQLMGSRSVQHLGLASGLPASQLIPIQGGEDYAFDGFAVKVMPSLHSALDDKHTIGEPIARDIKLPLTFAGYGEGGTFAYLVRVAGWKVLVLSTANFIEREIEGVSADVILIAPGLREEIYDYSCRLLRAAGAPAHAFATHFDDWQAPALGQVNEMPNFAAELQACQPGINFTIPRPFEPITLPGT